MSWRRLIFHQGGELQRREAGVDSVDELATFDLGQK